MKKSTLIFILLLAMTALRNPSFAQISEGGTPLGFQVPINQSNLIAGVEMPVVNVDSLQKEDAVNDKFKEIPWRFGYNHLVNLNLDNSGVTTTLNNGDHLWQLAIHCPDAVSINIAFNEFHIPKGARMFIYNQERTHVIGAFTDKTNQADHQLGCALLPGSSIIVEYFEPANVDFHGTLNIFRITQGYRSLFKHLKFGLGFGSSESCENNAICDPDWSKEKRGIACLVENGNASCSCSLLNDVPNDGTPYILTANHCGSSGFGSWVFLFNWDSPTCTPSNQGPQSYWLSGATQVAVNGHSDFNLLKLFQNIPDSFNVYYEGWSNLWVFADSTVGIHHPAGDVKKISHALAPTHDGYMQDEGNGPADVWRVGQWTDGVTEGGSSGSPMFDQNHRVVGQLYGGPSDCTVPTIDLYDVYGKFATSWDYGNTSGTRLKDWLDPGNTGALVNDGYDPNVTPYSLDAGILNINNPTQTNYCNDTITPIVVLRNFGSATLTSVTIYYQLDSQTPVPFSWTGSLPLHGMATVTLPAIIPWDGTHLLKVYTSMPNGSNDMNTANDMASVVFVTQLNSFPIFEGFEHAVFPYQTWRIGNPDGNDTWYRNNSLGGFGNSSACAEYDNYTNNSYAGQYDTIYSPLVDFSYATGPIKLSFSVAYQQASLTNSDSLNVSVSTDCGSTWSTVYAKGGLTLSTVLGLQTNAFTPTNSQWRSDTVLLNSLAGHKNVMFAFANYNANGNNIYLDDINITIGNTGIPSLSKGNNVFDLYPNPTDGMLNLTISLTQSSPVLIQVMNLLGETVATKTIDNTIGGSYSMNLSDLSQGIYFVQIKTSTETIVKRISLQK